MTTEEAVRDEARAEVEKLKKSADDFEGAYHEARAEVERLKRMWPADAEIRAANAEAALAAEQQCRVVEQRERDVAQLALIAERERSERCLAIAKEAEDESIEAEERHKVECAELRERSERLRKALGKYGRHASSCDATALSFGPYGVRNAGDLPCSCGLVAACDSARAALAPVPEQRWFTRDESQERCDGCGATSIDPEVKR